MEYYSTKNKTNVVSFRTAILQGIADDKGLFMPASIPQLGTNTIDNLTSLSFKDIAFIISKEFIQDEIEDSVLEQIIESSITFGTPLVNITDRISILELFHGPTLAFKDFGARFMARTMQYFMRNDSDELTILVATSGDTGSAVANGFLGVEGIKVIVLFPKNMVSKIQEKQITTLGKNILPVEIEGTFDDCQRLVKAAFVDSDIKNKIRLSSANSINIGRLIPQSFYYFEGFKQKKDGRKVAFSIPSGNLGNLTAGLMAMKMGLPVTRFIAATNDNDVFTKYLENGDFMPRNSKLTLSNAMDVGNPSNFVRIQDLFDEDHNYIKNKIYSHSFSDTETLEKINEIYQKFDYIIDPHGAVGYLAAEEYLAENDDNVSSIVLETAHPSKFMDVFNNNLKFQPKIPERLASSLKKDGHSQTLSKDYNDFKNFLLS